MATQDTIIANLLALGFDNPSNTALGQKLAEGLGFLVDSTLTEFTNTKQSILDTINNQRYGKEGYYTAKALAFQYGDDLVIDPTTLEYVYATIDPTKQIIKQAAFIETSTTNTSQLFLKVATVDTAGNTVALSLPQLAAFTSYFLNFQVPGLPVSIVSSAANVLYFQAKLNYYATYDLPTLQTNVLTALTNFRQSFAFNGEFFAGDLQDYVKANVPGVRDFFIYNTTIDNVSFSGFINLDSGYFNYVASIENNITYIAK